MYIDILKLFLQLSTKYCDYIDMIWSCDYMLSIPWYKNEVRKLTHFCHLGERGRGGKQSTASHCDIRVWYYNPASKVDVHKSRDKQFLWSRIWDLGWFYLGRMVVLKKN